MEEIINQIIDDSELARMAMKHFDEESAEKMVAELKEQIIKAVIPRE